MTDQPNDVALAIDLMHRAVTLLDEAGECLAATRLQHALDTVDPPPASGSTLVVVTDGRLSLEHGDEPEDSG